MRILVVDDERIKRVSLADDLAEEGHRAIAAASGEEAMALLTGDVFDVVVTDLRMPGIDGMALLKRISRDVRPRPEVIMMTAYGSIPLAVEAMKHGAFDFVTKPFRNSILLPLLKRVQLMRPRASAPQRRTGVDPDHLADTLVGASAAMREVRWMVDLCARTDATVLLTGETGTGKDLVAGTIHQLSSRRSGPFVKVNCAVFGESLVGSELYGHEKGAFTGADEARPGKFGAAQGGTLYLDDVDDIPHDQQIKLLRVIEEKVYEHVGGSAQLTADVRIIAATKKDLLAQIDRGAFRGDLYYRLNVLRIDLPALRDRLTDLPALADHLLERVARNKPNRLSDDVRVRLGTHRWPGNVRELAHALERANLIGDGVITAALLPAGEAEGPQNGAGATEGFAGTIRHAERHLLKDALAAADGNKSAAARSLGMKLSTFRDKLAKHGML